MTPQALAPFSLQAVNADAVVNVYSVHAAHGLHVGNLKRIGAVWIFKAIGYDAHGSVEPGGGPLTDQHNLVLAAPQSDEFNLRLSSRLAQSDHSSRNT